MGCAPPITNSFQSNTICQQDIKISFPNRSEVLPQLRLLLTLLMAVWARAPATKAAAPAMTLGWRPITALQQLRKRLPRPRFGGAEVASESRDPGAESACMHAYIRSATLTSNLSAMFSCAGFIQPAAPEHPWSSSLNCCACDQTGQDIPCMHQVSEPWVHLWKMQAQAGRCASGCCQCHRLSCPCWMWVRGEQ